MTIMRQPRPPGDNDPHAPGPPELGDALSAVLRWLLDWANRVRGGGQGLRRWFENRLRSERRDSHARGDRIHGDRIHGDRIHGDRIHGDRIHGDRVHGDRVHGDRIHGDRIHGDPSRNWGRTDRAVEYRRHATDSAKRPVLNEPPPLATRLAASEAGLASTMRSALRQRTFVRRAVVVNEILNRPVALRKRHGRRMS